jgi:hypothetical protein
MYVYMCVSENVNMPCAIFGASNMDFGCAGCNPVTLKHLDGEEKSQ